MEKTANLEKCVTKIMNLGFSKSAESFSRMLGKKVTLVNNHPSVIAHDIDYAHLVPKSGNVLILTTQMIGELTGKSYLMIAEADTGDIGKEVYRMPKEKLSSDICEAILLEIDNIISASVIGQIAGSLNKEVYGDVPVLQKINAADVPSFMRSDFTSNKSATHLIICNTTFHVEGYNRLQAHFIWKISAKIFELVPNEILA